MRLDPQEFWQAAIEIYSEPGQTDILVKAQDTRGENVNLALLAIYLQRQGNPLTLHEQAVLAQSIESFNAIHTRPLRSLRRQLSASTVLAKESREQLKQELLAAELTLEREEQRLLIQSLNQLRADA